MRLRTGNMLEVYGRVDLFLFTANATITTHGRLVMGAGMAKTVKTRIPDVDAVMADAITYFAEVHNIDNRQEALRQGHVEYNLVVREFTAIPGQYQRVGAFQVKHHWSSSATYQLITASCWELSHYIGIHGPMDVHLNFPGIGNGNLPRDQVLPIICRLPDCVTVWELP